MIFIQITEQLKLLNNLLTKLDQNHYNNNNHFLGNATIGGHTRHIIELLKCVTDGYESGNVDYINRSRNLAIEKDKSLAMEELIRAVEKINMPDKQLNLVLEKNEANTFMVTTTYFREISYNTEHIIHHLALIKVALREMKLEIVNDDFGMAYSTVKFLSSKK